MNEDECFVPKMFTPFPSWVCRTKLCEDPMCEDQTWFNPEDGSIKRCTLHSENKSKEALKSFSSWWLTNCYHSVFPSNSQLRCRWRCMLRLQNINCSAASWHNSSLALCPKRNLAQCLVSMVQRWCRVWVYIIVIWVICIYCRCPSSSYFG